MCDASRVGERLASQALRGPRPGGPDQDPQGAGGGPRAGPAAERGGRLAGRPAVPRRGEQTGSRPHPGGQVWGLPMIHLLPDAVLAEGVRYHAAVAPEAAPAARDDVRVELEKLAGPWVLVYWV